MSLNIFANYLNVDWVSEISSSFSDEEGCLLSCNSEEDNINLNDILKINIEKLNNQCKFKKCLSVLKFLKKQISNNLDYLNKNKTTFLNFLNFILNINKNFSKLLKLEKIEHNDKKNTLINRSSYKFCNYGYKCNYNYNHKKYSGCLAQHFVYNYVVSDVISLIDYIENNNNLKHIEIITCLNTITYVMNHMFQEYNELIDFYPNSYSNLHQERFNDKKLSKKNKNIQLK